MSPPRVVDKKMFSFLINPHWRYLFVTFPFFLKGMCRRLSHLWVPRSVFCFLNDCLDSSSPWDLSGQCHFALTFRRGGMAGPPPTLNLCDWVWVTRTALWQPLHGPGWEGCRQSASVGQHSPSELWMLLESVGLAWFVSLLSVPFKDDREPAGQSQEPGSIFSPEQGKQQKMPDPSLPEDSSSPSSRSYRNTLHRFLGSPPLRPLSPLITVMLSGERAPPHFFA